MLQGLIIANADPSVFWLNNFYLFIYLLLRFAYGGVLLMTAFLKIYPISKIRNIPIYRLARNISYRNPCIVIRIVSPDSCQYTALYRRSEEVFCSAYIKIPFFKSRTGFLLCGELCGPKSQAGGEESS